MDENRTSGLLTIGEIAEILRVHRSTLYRLIKRREFPYLRVGSDYRVVRRDFTKWVENQEVTAVTKPSPSARGKHRWKRKDE